MQIMEWRSMDTAPLDGTDVLIAITDKWPVLCIGYYDSDAKGWRELATEEILNPPSHWMPLPKMPNIDGSEDLIFFGD